MSFDVSALGAYIEDRDFPLIGAIQFNPEMTAMMATKQTGVKGSSNLHFMSTDVVFQDGAGCARSGSATTEFTDKTLTVGQIGIYEDLCLDDLRNKWTQILLEKGTLTGKQVMPSEIAEVYFDEKSKLLAQALDTADWQGDTASGNAQLVRYDGWLKFIDAGTPVNGNPTGITTGTGITAANIISILQGMWQLQPQNIRNNSDLTIFLGQEIYDLYIMALINANLFHYVGEDGITKLFGTNLSVRPTFGLNGTNRLILTYGKNLVIGVDGENDEEFTFRVDPVTNKKILVDADFTRGTQVQFVEDVVDFTLV